MIVRRSTVATVTAALLIVTGVLDASRALHAQQAVNETRDPKQTQDDDFAKLYAKWTGEREVRQPARRSPAARRRHPDAEGRARLLHRRAGEAHVLRRHPEVLPRAREGVAAREDRDDRQVGRRSASSSSSGCRRTRTSRISQHNRDNLAKIADPRGLTRRAGARAHRRRRSRTTTSWAACTAARPVRRKC